MKLLDVLEKVGTAVFSEVVPGGGAILSAVNSLLGNDELDEKSTGAEVKKAIDRLPEDKRAEIYAREIDYKIAEVRSWTEIQQALNQADGVGRSTRPEIAKQMSTVVCFTIVLFVSCLAVVILKSDDPLASINESWALMLTLIGTPLALLRGYFGMRTAEKKSRYAAASGQSIPNLFSSVTSLFK